MSISPDYSHDVHVYRTRSGWQRWHAACPCGWRWTGTGGREDAERAGRTHEGVNLTHTCYDPGALEYGDPCPACLGEDVTPRTPLAREIGEYLAEQLPEDQP